MVEPASTGRRLPRPDPRRLAASLAAAACMVLGCPDYDLWWLGFIGWVPWLAAIEGLRPGRAFLYGWLCGTLTVFWGFFWLTELLTKYGGMPFALAVPVTLLFAMWQGLLWALPAALLAWLRGSVTGGVMVLAPVCWVAVEAVLPNIFPVYMALIWAWQPLWIQVAELGGPTTISAVILAINASLYVVVRSASTSRGLHRRALAVLVVLLVAVPGYGAIRIAQVEAAMEAAPKLKIGVVQGNMSIRELQRKKTRLRVFEDHRRKSRELESDGAELIVWGETSFPFGRVFVRDSRHEPPEDHPLHIRQGFDAPVLFGTVTTDASGENPYPWNTALLIGRDGMIGGRYDKAFLLIFGEYVPVVDPKWFGELFPAAAHFNAGAEPGVIELDGHRLGTLICYEDILPRFVRGTAREGAHAFVNLTNDSWFGATAEPIQHLGLAVFRTIEHRRALVRAVNTGTSAYVDPTGRVQEQTAVTDPDVQGRQQPDGFVAEVPMIGPETLTTPYFVTGELFNVLCILAVLGLAARVRFGRAASVSDR